MKMSVEADVRQHADRVDEQTDPNAGSQRTVLTAPRAARPALVAALSAARLRRQRTGHQIEPSAKRGRDGSLVAASGVLGAATALHSINSVQHHTSQVTAPPNSLQERFSAHAHARTEPLPPTPMPPHPPYPPQQQPPEFTQQQPPQPQPQPLPQPRPQTKAAETLQALMHAFHCNDAACQLINCAGNKQVCGDSSP